MIPTAALDTDAREALQVIHDEHRALESMLLTIPLLIAQRRARGAPPNFTVLRAMLCYIAEYPERQHHPKEDTLLFPAVRAARPDLAPVLDKLALEHAAGDRLLSKLERTLTAWECLGENRADAFVALLDDYVHYYLSHMQLEERAVLPAARESLSPAQWHVIAQAFRASEDPIAGSLPQHAFRDLHDTILASLPDPLGYGSSD
jgi:hemerythrin-like domain-containing protein